MKKPILSLIFMIMMGFSISLQAESPEAVPDSIGSLKVNPEPCRKETTPATDTIFLVLPDQELSTADSLFSKPMIKNETKRKRIVSGLLALPFPFGFIGAHRVMLGSKPWVPVVYIATFGGCFGLLPLIDFCAIMFSKDIEQYENNSQIFMWLK